MRILPGVGFVEVADLEGDRRLALESSAQLAEPGPRGRPPLDDEPLRRLARDYLATAADRPGLVRRLARQFDRPEPTIKDWIAAARERGFLSAAVPGRRGAAPRVLVSPQSGRLDPAVHQLRHGSAPMCDNARHGQGVFGQEGTEHPHGAPLHRLPQLSRP